MRKVTASQLACRATAEGELGHASECPEEAARVLISLISVLQRGSAPDLALDLLSQA